MRRYSSSPRAVGAIFRHLRFELGTRPTLGHRTSVRADGDAAIRTKAQAPRRDEQAREASPRPDRNGGKLTRFGLWILIPTV
jgi:hypothetical protein